MNRPMPDWAKRYHALTEDDRGPTVEEIIDGVMRGPTRSPGRIRRSGIRDMVEEYALLMRDGCTREAESMMDRIIFAFEEKNL